MELVYLYIDNYRNFKEAEFNFGQDVRLHFENAPKKLTARRCDPALPDGSWGGNIKNLTALIGNNGSGKTSVFQFIILLLKEMWGELYGIWIQGNGIIAFKENETIFWYANRSFEETGQIRAECDTDLAGRSTAEMYGMRNLISDKVSNIMRKTKFIYLTGSLSREDYQRGMLNGSGRYDHLYDASPGNLISQDMGMDVNRALRLRIPRYPQEKRAAYFSEIETYFAYEQYKQIKYVFDRNQSGMIRKMRQDGYPVPVPDVLHIELRAWSGTDEILCQKELPQKISFRDMEEAVCGKTISHFIDSFPRPSVRNEQEKQQYFIGLLRFHLQLSGIICAFRSAARLMDEGNLYIMFRNLPQHLDIKDSFFLENGTIGQFAQSKINGTYRELLDLEREIDRAKQDRQGWAEKRAKLISDLSGRYRKLAEVISEPLIREKMKEKIGSLLRQLDAPVQRPDAAAEGYGRMTEKELRRQLALIEEELGKRSRKREL